MVHVHFSRLIFCARLLKWNELCNEFFRQFHRALLNVIDVGSGSASWRWQQWRWRRRAAIAALSPVKASAGWTYLRMSQCLSTLTRRCGNLFFQRFCWTCSSQNYRLLSGTKMQFRWLLLSLFDWFSFIWPFDNLTIFGVTVKIELTSFDYWKKIDCLLIG